MKQVARDYRWKLWYCAFIVAVSMPSLLIVGKGDFTFNEVTQWIKGFEIHLRGRGCSWNTVSTYLRTFRAVYNRAVDCRGAVYVPHLFRSVYTAPVRTVKRALDTGNDIQVFANYPWSSAVTSDMRRTQRYSFDVSASWSRFCRSCLFCVKSDLHDNGLLTWAEDRPLSVTF